MAIEQMQLWRTQGWLDGLESIVTILTTASTDIGFLKDGTLWEHTWMGSKTPDHYRIQLIHRLKEAAERCLNQCN